MEGIRQQLYAVYLFMPSKMIVSNGFLSPAPTIADLGQP